MDASQMNERCVGDGRLIAITHVQRMDASQMHERCVADGRLMATPHVQRMDASQMSKHRVADGHLVAVFHIKYTNPFQPCKVRVRQVAPVGNIRANSFGNTSTPSFQASADPSHRIIPFMLCNSATCSTADPARAESIPRCEGTENAGAKMREAAAVQQLVDAGYLQGRSAVVLIVFAPLYVRTESINECVLSQLISYHADRSCTRLKYILLSPP
jgi:hypothetical protein